MALFTDFFPSPGNDISSNPGVMRGTAGTFTFPTVTTPSVMVTLTGDTSGLTIETGDIASFSFMGVSYSGIVADTVIARAAGTSVNIALSAPVAFTAGTTTPTFAGGSQTVIEGDSHTGGDSFTAGDTTVQGDTSLSGDLTVDGDVTNNGDSTFNGDIIQTGGVGTDFTTNAETVNLGDSDSTEVNINGDEITIGDSTSVTSIDGELNINAGTDDAVNILGLAADTEVVGITAGNGLELTSVDSNFSRLDISALALNNTYAVVDNSATTTDADALLNFTTAYTEAGVTTLGVTVDVGSTLSSGDLVLITSNDGTVTDTESYIYIGADRTADASSATNIIMVGDFVDVTHSGDVVETITSGANIQITGSATAPVISANLAPSLPTEILFNNNGIIDGSVITQTESGGVATVTVGANTTVTGSVTATSLDVNGAADISGTVALGATDVRDSLTLSQLAAVTTESRGLIIDAAGVVSAGSPGGSGITVVIATDADTTITAGDLVVLPIIGGNRTLTLPASPTMGDTVRISNLSATGLGSGIFRWSLGLGTQNIMGTTIAGGLFQLDDATASFDIVYTDVTNGWVIIGAN